VNEFLSRFSVPVLNTCYRFMMNREDAEDLSQEVFIEIMRSVSAFRGQSGLSTWVHRVAVSKCLDELKKRKRKKRITSAGRLIGLESVAAWLVGDLQADKPLEEKEQLAVFRQAMDRLPASMRVAFTLSRMDGYTPAEVAAIMNIKRSAVDSLVHRAGKKLRQQLERGQKKDKG
jgi:RNA polymerase sigma-70 factor (ECF subfamily)